MPKILAQAGISLADVYDVQGSIAGTEELASRDVSLMHEMGGQIFSERLLFFTETIDALAVNQSTEFEVEFAALPDCPNRILNCSVVINNATRVDSVQLSITPPAADAGSDSPFFVWDTAVDIEQNILISLGGGAAGNRFCLSPLIQRTPTLITRGDVTQVMPTINMRGITSAFGAGDVSISGIVHLCRAQPESPAPGAPSSHGLPLPSW